MNSIYSPLQTTTVTNVDGCLISIFQIMYHYIGLFHGHYGQNTYRSEARKSLGLSCVLIGSMYHQTFFIPCLCPIIKNDRSGNGGGGHLKLRLPAGGGGGNVE